MSEPTVKSTPRRARGGWARFLFGVLCGCVLIVGGRELINETTFADRLVRPLLRGDTTGPADAIVVLGAGVIGPCVPNDNGVRRVLHGARLWREGRARTLLITGGTAEGPCPVAAAMARLAMDIGIPESNIVIESVSLSTHENAQRSATVLRGLGIRRVLLVTDMLHMPRAQASFEHYGLDVQRSPVPVYEGHANNVSMLGSAAREYLALAYYRARGWIGPRADAGAGHAAHENGAVPTAGAAVTAGNGMDEKTHGDGPIVILGASYAQGWDPKVIAEVPIINKGMPGQQSFEMLERFERDVVPARPRAVILWGFINDVFRAKPENMDAALARVRDSYTKMIDLSRRHGIEPIVATEVTVRPSDSWSEVIASWVGGLMGKESYQDRINRHVIETNRWLADVGRRERLLVLDFQAALGEDDGRRRREFVQEDGSHITPAAYAALTEYAKPVLEKHLATRRAGS
jgi:uncharacterized SAM-binding protein YcdF (DUF218 family)/lysophospholipase L1-like esterase